MDHKAILKIADRYIAKDKFGNRPTDFKELYRELTGRTYEWTGLDSGDHTQPATSPYRRFLYAMREYKGGDADLFTTQWRIIAVIKEITTDEHSYERVRD